MKNSFIKSKIVEFLNSKKYYGIIVYGLFVSLMSALNTNDVTIIDSWCNIYTNYFFLSIGLFLLVAYATQESLENFSKDYMLFTRFKSKKTYNLFSIVYTLIIVTIVYITLLVCTIISCNLLNFNGYKIYDFENYNILNIVYYIYLFIRNYFYSIIFSLFNMIVYNQKKKIILVIFILFWSTSFILLSKSEMYISSIKNITIIPQKLMLNTTIYENFHLDFICNSIVIVFYLVVVILLLKLFSNKKEDIG